MTLKQQEKDALTEHWSEAKAQLVPRFPGVDESTMAGGPDAERIASATGQDRAQVESVLSEIAKQYTGKQNQ